MQSAHASYASVGAAVNSAPAVRTLEATFFLGPATCEEMDKLRGSSSAAGSGFVRTRKGAVLGLEVPFDPREGLERPVERVLVVGGHHARP
jgi:hypothetical protein